MGSGFTILNSLSGKSMAGADQTSYARFRTSDISIFDIYSSDRNFYTQEGIEEKAAEIHAVGLLSNLVVADSPSPDGTPYRLISGERRWRALCLLVERGYKEFETVTCQVRAPQDEHTEMIELIIANSAREKDIATLIREEQTLKNELQYMKEHGLQLNGYDLQNGKLRNVIAAMLNVSSTKIAEIERVAKHLLPAFKTELESKKMNFSAAYQLSKLQTAEQEELYAKYQEEGELSYKDVQDYAREKEVERAKEQIPGQMNVEEMLDPEEAVEESVVEDSQKDSLGKEQVSQSKIDSDVYLFYKHTMTQQERDILHEGSLSFGKVKMMLTKRLSHVGTGCSLADGYKFQTLGGGWVRFGSDIAGHSMTIFQILNQLKTILERSPMLRIFPKQEQVAIELPESCQSQETDSEQEQSVAVAQEDAANESFAEKKESLKEVELEILQHMIAQEMDYIRMCNIDAKTPERARMRHQIALDAFRFYKKHLGEVMAYEPD